MLQYRVQSIEQSRLPRILVGLNEESFTTFIRLFSSIYIYGILIEQYQYRNTKLPIISIYEESKKNLLVSRIILLLFLFFSFFLCVVDSFPFCLSVSFSFISVFFSGCSFHTYSEKQEKSTGQIKEEMDYLTYLQV